MEYRKGISGYDRGGFYGRTVIIKKTKKSANQTVIGFLVIVIKKGMRVKCDIQESLPGCLNFMRGEIVVLSTI